ncbi:hypothetical protein NC651_028862 [Populus alba x Populus x berolinensis]|nr:hypothetical protein NC651_028862 [Populus alba x Populus x berolinensis]
MAPKMVAMMASKMAANGGVEKHSWIESSETISHFLGGISRGTYCASLYVENTCREPWRVRIVEKSDL